MTRTLSHNHTVQTDFGKMYWLIDYTPDGKIVGATLAHRRQNEDYAITKLAEQLSESLDIALKSITNQSTDTE